MDTPRSSAIALGVDHPVDQPDPQEVAAALHVSIGLLAHRLRQVPVQEELTMPEISALARLERAGPATPGAMANAAQISPQGMGATLAALEERGYVRRQPDPTDGRRATSTPIVWIVVVTLLFGVTLGTTASANQTTLYTQVTTEQIGVASGLFRTFGYLGSIASSAVISIAFHTSITDHDLHTIAWMMVAVSAAALALVLADRSIMRQARPDTRTPTAGQADTAESPASTAR